MQLWSWYWSYNPSPHSLFSLYLYCTVNCVVQSVFIVQTTSISCNDWFAFFRCFNHQCNSEIAEVLRGIQGALYLPTGLCPLLRGEAPSNDHKFRNSFEDCINPICSCGHDIEATTRLLIHCSHYICIVQSTVLYNLSLLYRQLVYLAMIGLHFSGVLTTNVIQK